MFSTKKSKYYDFEKEDNGNKVITEYNGLIYDDESIKETVNNILNGRKNSSDGNANIGSVKKNINNPYNKEIRQLQKELYKLRKMEQLDDKSKELRKIKLEKINQARNLFKKIENGDPELVTDKDIGNFIDSNPEFWRNHTPKNATNVKELLGVVKHGEGSAIYSFRIKLERLKRKVYKKS